MDQRAKALPTLGVLHHLASTGGTAISRVIASDPNALLIGEAHPIDFRNFTTPWTFQPTNVAALAANQGLPNRSRLQSKAFRDNVKLVHSASVATGRKIVVRDHSHTDYMTSLFQPGIQSVTEALTQSFHLHEVVTVRDPLRSYVSSVRRTFFTPNDLAFSAYLARYWEFLDTYNGLPLFRFEDLMLEPKTAFPSLFGDLGLVFLDEYLVNLSDLPLSGDNREGKLLYSNAFREFTLRSRVLPEAVEYGVRIQDLSQLRDLWQRMGYNSDVLEGQEDWGFLRRGGTFAPTNERSQMLKEREELLKEREELLKEREELLKEREELLKERDNLSRSLHKANAELTAILGSRIWRYMSPLIDWRQRLNSTSTTLGTNNVRADNHSADD